MDTNIISRFISVAEHLNFTKAAEANYVSQQALSQQIIALEKDLNIKLLDRNNRSVRLTPAGKLFYEASKATITRLDRAVAEARQITAGENRTLSFAYSGPYEKMLATKLIEKYHAAYPGIIIYLRQASNCRIVEGLASGLLDVALAPPYTFRNIRNMQYQNIGSSSMCVVMSNNHPLAAEKRIDPAALVRENFIILNHDASPMDEAKLMQDCMNIGFAPKIIMRPLDYESLLALVEAGIGVTLIHYDLKKCCGPSLAFIKINCAKHLMKSEAGLVWMKDNENPLVASLLDAV